MSDEPDLEFNLVESIRHHSPVDPSDGGPGPVGEVHGHDGHLGAVASPQLLAETLLYREINLHRQDTPL